MNDKAAEVKPCPFCGCKMHLSDYQDVEGATTVFVPYLNGQHDDMCPFLLLIVASIKKW